LPQLASPPGTPALSPEAGEREHDSSPPLPRFGGRGPGGGGSGLHKFYPASNSIGLSKFGHFTIHSYIPDAKLKGATRRKQRIFLISAAARNRKPRKNKRLRVLSTQGREELARSRLLLGERCFRDNRFPQSSREMSDESRPKPDFLPPQGGGIPRRDLLASVRCRSTSPGPPARQYVNHPFQTDSRASCPFRLTPPPTYPRLPRRGDSFSPGSLDGWTRFRSVTIEVGPRGEFTDRIQVNELIAATRR